MSFKVPDSSPPSTPDRRSNNNGFSFGPSNPSTTPAGPPPSSAGSYTPAGPPPTSIFGSSMLGGSIRPLSFGQPSPSPLKFGIPASSPPGREAGTLHDFQTSNLGSEYQPTPRKGYGLPSDDEDEEGEGEEDEDEDEDEDEEEGSVEYMDEKNSDEQGDDEAGMNDEDGSYEEDEEMGGYGRPGSASEESDYNAADSDIVLPSTEVDLGRSILGLKDSKSRSASGPSPPSIYGQIAKNLYGNLGLPEVNEADDIVLNTEALVARLYEEGSEDESEETLHSALTSIPADLIKLWGEHVRQTTSHNSEEYFTRIGPGPQATDFACASFLAGLTLKVHHPEIISRAPGNRSKPLPGTMLEWLDEQNDPFSSQLEEVQVYRPGPSNHPLFWDAIFNGLIRGKVYTVVTIMNNGNWKYARGGVDDIRDRNNQSGYTGITLKNVEAVVAATTQVLSDCPAINGDWNIRSSDWTLFRVRASQAKDELQAFAEGRDRIDEGNGSTIGQGGRYSASVQKAQSRVPWHIYQNLLTLYNLVLGETNSIIANAHDWCEATVGLLAWWNESAEDKRVNFGRSKFTTSRLPDHETFLRQLQKSFIVATADELKVDTADSVQVSLASLLEGDIESVMGFLRAWSGPVSSATAEIGSLAGWLPNFEPQSLIDMGSLDQEDLDLLQYDAPSKMDGIKDQTLIAYARALINRGTLRSQPKQGVPQLTREGWEVAISILGRLDSAIRSEEMVGEFLSIFVLDSSETVNKLWTILNHVGMSNHAEAIAENYAKKLGDTSHNYGEALWYYSLAHKRAHVKDVLDLLISYSLIQSVSYPAEPELDDYLKRLIHYPSKTLQELASMDRDAAQLLHGMLSGYATLRKFYNLRDAELIPLEKESLQTARARRVEAAKSLMAVITSSDDNIRGGLYDEERGAVVSVDFLLALLGESLVFVNQPGAAISLSHIDILLKAIEDIQTVGPRVYNSCNEFLQTVIASGQGLKGSSPADLLRKSTSNMSGSSFSMVGSSMLASQMKQSMGSSGVLVKGNIKRGWDWRQGISAGTTSEDLVKTLRLGLAKDLAKAWLDEADNII